MLATVQRPNRQSETAELGRIFEEQHARLYRAAYRITGSASDAEDVLQNVFLNLARQEAGPDRATPLDGYLYRAAINAALDVCRARARQPLVDPMRLAEPVATGAGPGDELELSPPRGGARANS